MIVSIDIGTSYSSISMLGPDGKAQSIDIGTGVSMYGDKHSLPSAVFVEEDGRVLLGQDALNNRMRDPKRFRDEFKRNLGESIPIMLGSRSFLPEQLYTEFFCYMKERAEKVSGEPIELAYLTYPAAYGTSKKNKILSAAKAAGLYNVELVDEPTAAAMSYCAAGYIKEGQNLLIYDFGGGTFDAALIRYENGVFTPLASPKGLERCGGIDIDRLIFQNMMSKVDASTLEMLRANTLHYMRFVSQLSELAVKCKHQLSSPEVDSFSGYIQVGFDMIPYTLTLDDYNRMIAGKVGQTVQTCRQILEEARLKVEDLGAVLLVGGTSRVRLVREMVEQLAGNVPVYCAADLELAVSQGALNYRNYKQESPIPDALANEEPVEMKQKDRDAAPVSEETVSENGNPEIAPEELKQGQQYASAEDAVSEARSGFARGWKFAGNKDWNAAFRCFSEAAKLGDANAMESLAVCYRQGLGVAKNAELADIWSRKAADARITGNDSSESGKQEKTGEPKAVFFVNDTRIVNQTVIVSGSLCGKVPLTDGAHLGAFDEEGRFLGHGKAKLPEGTTRITEDSIDVTLELTDYMGSRKADLAIDCLVSMPVDVKSFNQVFADREQEGCCTTRVSYVYEDPKMRIDFEDAYCFYVTDIRDGKLYGRSLFGSMSDDLRMYVYSAASGAARRELRWKDYAARGSRAYFVADCTGIQKGDIITDCIAPSGYTFRGQRISFWRYRLIIAVQKEAAKEAPPVQPNDPVQLTELGQKLARQGKGREAFEAFQKAANLNYAPAQYHLAGCYERGYGTAADLSNAKLWYHRAAAQGNTAAQDRLKQLERVEKPKAAANPEQIIRDVLKETGLAKRQSNTGWNVENGVLIYAVSWMITLRLNLRVGSSETVLLAEDWTTFGRGKSGFIFTEKGIYERLSPFPPRFIPWAQFAKEELQFVSGNAVTVDNSIISGSSNLPRAVWTRLHERLRG